ncbi:hypothetical protein NDU88_000738 [Pleurodeles waltl]|uniref:Alpha-macroglobulin receptor-binding domain-containing protein n=1 Tax=Pleurodeles waltl TaxID=8319 RepID=A0AAV7P260_PLEWA|nr:hypothetical protein NDU88_000738 [Pleurodeles waltl]
MYFSYLVRGVDEIAYELFVYQVGDFKPEQPTLGHKIGEPQYLDAELFLEPFYSKSKSFLKIHPVLEQQPCDYIQDLQVEYIIQQNMVPEDARQMDLYYLVTLRFSPEEALPGADITLQLYSVAGSLYSVRAVDKRTVLMQPKEELTGEKGGIEDNLALSTYITAAMLELGLNETDSTVKKALACLKESLPNVTNTYTLSLMAYAFTLAGDKEARDEVMTALKEQAVKSEGQIHWGRKDRPKPQGVHGWFRAASIEVEITSYVLLAYMSQPQVPIEDLSTVTEILEKKAHENKTHVKKVEIKPDEVTIYLNQLSKIPNQFSFVEQDQEVKGLKPATVVVYDYYEKGE